VPGAVLSEAFVHPSEVAVPAEATVAVAAPRGGREVFRFGLFELELHAGELRRGGVLVHLSDQPFRLLSLLASRAGEIVGRDEIRERLWGPEVHVEFDQGINTLVREVRRALHDDAASPRFIATVPRRGYRFVAPVERIAPATGVAASRPVATEGADDEPPPDAGNSRGRRPRLVGLLSILAAVAVCVATPVAREVSRPPRDSTPIPLAVLPFESLAAEGDRDRFGAGLSEELIARLGRRFRGRLQVIAPTTVPTRGYPATDPRTLGRDLGAEYLLTGTIRSNGRQLRVSARLVETDDGTVRWAAVYQREPTAVLDVQRRLATSIAEALAVQILPPPAWSPRGAASAEAFAAYLRGQSLLKRARELGRGGERALPAFEHAVELDPGFAAAWIGLARATLWNGRSARRSRARRYLSRGLALDDELAEGHLLRGELALFDERDFDQALRSYRRALEIDPHSEPVHRAIACWQQRTRAAAPGRSAGRLASVETAGAGCPPVWVRAGARTSWNGSGRIGGD